MKKITLHTMIEENKREILSNQAKLNDIEIKVEMKIIENKKQNKFKKYY